VKFYNQVILLMAHHNG